MGIRDAVRGVIAGMVIERPAAGKSYGEWRATLEKSGRAIDDRAASAKDPVAAQHLLRHVAGIERWGQSRLRVFLGAPFVRDEYDAYRPGEELSRDEQRAVFRATRAETIDLARQIEQAGVPATATVEHNQFGPLSARGWLRYLEMHASLEARRLR